MDTVSSFFKLYSQDTEFVDMQACHVHRTMKEISPEKEDLVVTKKATSFAWKYFSYRKVDIDQKQELQSSSNMAN